MLPPTVNHLAPPRGVTTYWIGRAWMNFFGWDVDPNIPQVDRAILIAAPHTSNWDLAHMLAASYVFRIRIGWLGKHTLFKPPFGWFMRALGGVPVDRRSPQGLVGQVTELFAGHDRLWIAVPAEGTRGRGEGWKSGFYWMAHGAQVPVICGFLDYQNRRAGFGYTFVPTGNVAEDMEKVRAFYANIVGKFPAQQSPVRLKEETPQIAS